MKSTFILYRDIKKAALRRLLADKRLNLSAREAIARLQRFIPKLFKTKTELDLFDYETQRS